MIGRLVTAALTAFMLALPSVAALAQDNDGAATEDVLMSADEVSYDDELGTVTASGSVEISQGERVLLADTVTYNQAEDLITATGDVTLLEPGGEVVFADYVELKDQMKDGVIRKLKILLTDKSRFAANGALRTGGNRTDMSKAVYSPCQLCPGRWSNATSAC